MEPERGQVAVGVQRPHALQAVDGSLNSRRKVDKWWNGAQNCTDKNFVFALELSI